MKNWLHGIYQIVCFMLSRKRVTRSIIILRARACEECNFRGVIFCEECGCILYIKQRLSDETCPINEWK
jgi:hypothetical protein